MNVKTAGICALGFLMVVGCDQLERVVGLGHQAQEEAKREYDRKPQTEESQTSLRAERESLAALIDGKLLVLSNRVAEAEAAMRALQVDRNALSRELGAASGGGRDAGGAGLERALASPVVNGLAMKYLRMDFSVVRGEYAEAIAQARTREAEFKRAIQKLDRTVVESVDPNPQAAPAARRSKSIAALERERDQLERRRSRLARASIPTGDIYRNKRMEHDREVRTVEDRLRTVERTIDQLKVGDERSRREADRIARQNREKALSERNHELEKLKREIGALPSVLKTVQDYGEQTLRRLERALVRESAALEEKVRKSREDCLTLRGIRASVPGLSSEGLKKLHGQVAAY